MANIIKTFREELPEIRLIGKKYTDADRDTTGSYQHKWGEWFAQKTFAQLQVCHGLQNVSDCFVGAMRVGENGFEYWIGCLMAPDDPTPAGFESVLLPAGGWGVCFVYGKDQSPELFGMDVHESCMAAYAAEGWGLLPGGWVMERYSMPRYTEPDEKGNVILDYCAQLA